jgi:hypothetical protein
LGHLLGLANRDNVLGRPSVPGWAHPTDPELGDESACCSRGGLSAYPGPVCELADADIVEGAVAVREDGGVVVREFNKAIHEAGPPADGFPEELSHPSEENVPDRRPGEPCLRFLGMPQVPGLDRRRRSGDNFLEQLGEAGFLPELKDLLARIPAPAKIDVDRHEHPGAFRVPKLREIPGPD